MTTILLTCPSCRTTVQRRPGDVVVSTMTGRVAFLHEDHIRWVDVPADRVQRLLDVGCRSVEDEVPVPDPIGLLRALAVLEAAETVGDLWPEASR